MSQESSTPARTRTPKYNLEGQRFGRLVVIRRDNPGPRGQSYWLCVCDCGVEKVIAQANILNGHIRSCGCLSRETTIKRQTTHGLAGRVDAPEYQIWQAMKNRCYNGKMQSYKDYGGRGIEVCERWRESFTAFIEDMGRRPSAEHSIERRNNDGNYEPSNCFWATRLEQGRNKRNNRFIEHEGVTRTIAEWGRILGVNDDKLRSRLDRGWDVARTLTTPFLKSE